MDLEISQGKQSRWGESEGAAGRSGGSKAFRDGCPVSLGFHFNRLSPEPGLTDKDNENKSLS